MTNTKFAYGLAIVVVALVGCGGADGPADEKPVKPAATSTRPGDPPVPTDTTDPTEPNQTTGKITCSLPGEKGNSLGIGEFCKKGDKCGGDGRFCTADFNAPEGAQFCTLFCAADSDCGPDAICFHEARGQACVLNKCNAK